MPCSLSRGRSVWALLALLASSCSRQVEAQVLPTEPIVLGDGRLTIAGDVSAAYSCAFGATLSGCSADEGYFNYTSYDHSLFRNLRVNLTASVKASERISVLTEVRTENGRRPEPYALFLRVRPWSGRRFDLQIGRIPPSFGAFSRRPYPADNFLIGYPLAYQYLTSLRPDALPASADELIRMRGRGWRSSFSVGNQTASAGLPLVNGLVWDTGVQAQAASDRLQAAISVTTGTLGHPLVRDNNAGKQISGRFAVEPLPGLVVGASGAHGPYAARAAATSAGLAGDPLAIAQTAWEGDVEYSRGHYVVRGEAIVSRYHLPSLASAPLSATAISVEGRYRLRPGLYAAGRWDRLDFSDIRGTTTASWDARVTRTEAGLGYSVRRNLLLKAIVQHNDRDGGRVGHVVLPAAQLVYWF